MAPPGQRVHPTPQPSIVHLGHLPRRHRVLGDLDVLRPHPPDPLAHVAAEAAHAHLQAPLVVRPLPGRAHRVGLQPGHDLCVVRLNPLPRPTRPRHHPLREEPQDQLLPLSCRAGPVPGHHSSLLHPRDHLAEPNPPHAHALRQSPDRVPGVPQPQRFHHLCHQEPPGRHRLSFGSLRLGLLSPVAPTAFPPPGWVHCLTASGSIP
jgi:hypothetical protein